MLEIYLLGQFLVLLDGRPVRIPERPAQSLLAYLALTVGREHRREKLAGMLWPDAPEANSRKYLRHALWRIRNSLQEAGSDPDEFLHVSEISLAVKEDPPLWLDAHQLLRASPADELSESELIDAVSLYQGELLPGFFEDWTALEREQVRAHVQRLMQVLLDRLLRQQRWREAEEWGERWIALGDVPEPAYRAVMVARAGSGNRSGAVATYQRAVADLKRELGLEPSPSLRSTFDDLTQPIPRLLKHRDRLKDSAGRLRGELRPVTILQVDLVGMTPLAASDDLESLKEILDESVGSLVDEVLSYEGTIVRVENDGLLACFGAPVAHEDDTRRTLMTALQMRNRFRPTSHDQHSLRIGVEAGELLVGEHGWDVRLGYSAVGRAVNLAGLLKSGAQKSEILVGEAAYNEARFAFEFGPGRNVEAEEPDQVRAHPLLSVKTSNPDWITEHRITPLVGREDELATLLRMVDAGEHGAVFVVGEPGIGKSRLIDEVRRRRREIRWGQGNCVSFGANLPYHPLAEAIGSLIDQDIELDPGSTREHLRHVFVGVSENQRVRHELAISRLLGIDVGWSTPPDRADIDPVSLVDAVLTLFGELGRDRPLVLTIEDVHWADDATITLIRQVLKQNPTPALVLILSMRPIWETSAWIMREDLLTSNGFRIEEIHLEGLDEQAMSELLDSVGPPPRRVKDVLIRRSDGNPFFLEEMHRTLVDTGVLTHRAGEWRLEGDLGPFDVPSTVQKTILARADQLPETERWVLQAASVTGWQFPESILEAVSGVEVRQPLETLAKADFVRLKSLTPEPIYVFRHSLIREAIERTLLKSDRRRLHLRAGEALESVLENRPDIQPALLVYHYVLAGAPERALRFAPAMAELAWRAVAPLESAHALELALQQDPPPDLALRLLVSVARARFAAADIAAGIEAYDKAIRIAHGIDDLSMMAECMADAAMYRWQTTESRESRWEYLESAIRSVASIPDSRGKLLLLQEAARQYLSAGEVGRAKDFLVAARRGLEALSGAERASLESHLLNTEGLLALREGQFERGTQLLHRALMGSEHPAVM